MNKPSYKLLRSKISYSNTIYERFTSYKDGVAHRTVYEWNHKTFDLEEDLRKYIDEIVIKHNINVERKP